MHRAAALACAVTLLLLSLPRHEASALADLRVKIAAQLGQKDKSPMISVLQICMNSPSDCAELTVSALTAADESAQGKGSCFVSDRQTGRFKSLTRDKKTWEAFYKKFAAGTDCLSDANCQANALKSVGSNPRGPGPLSAFYEAPACEVLCHMAGNKCGSGDCSSITAVGCKPRR